MDFVPTQDVAYEPHDELTVIGHPEMHVRLVYEDWNGTQQERTVRTGTWPCRTTKLLGYRVMDSQEVGGWSTALLPLSDASPGIEFSVGKSLEQVMPTQMRRGR